MPEGKIDYTEWRTAIDAARDTTRRNIPLTDEQLAFIEYARTGVRVVPWTKLAMLFNAQFGTSYKYRALDYKYTQHKTQEVSP